MKYHENAHAHQADAKEVLDGLKTPAEQIAFAQATKVYAGKVREVAKFLEDAANDADAQASALLKGHGK